MLQILQTPKILWVAAILLWLISALIFLGGCNLYSSSDSQSSSKFTGYWIAESGDINLNCCPREIYYYNWYIIETMPSGNEASVTWDNGRSCITTLADLKENEIRLTVNDVRTIFKFENENNAIVTFALEDGKVLMKELIKKRESTGILCM